MTVFTNTAEVSKRAKQIAELLEIAANQASRAVAPCAHTSTEEHLLSAAWRLADAGILLRSLLADIGVTEGAGIDIPTGRSALLPASTSALAA